ncbi:MAG: hypothetical protein LUI87_09430 [Lachnospiraceae bacterium]|nr:hypothetical protein [Lachnospiraceae bacterium]
MIRKSTEKIQKRSGLLPSLLRAVTLLTVTLLAATLSGSMFASADNEMPDLSRTGSITLTLTDDDTGEAIPGGTIAIWKVAALVSGDTGFVWQYTEDFSDCTESLDYLESTELIDALVSYAEEKGLEAKEISIDSEGTAVYDGVSVGLYLIVQTQTAEGYEPFLSFLVSVPCETSSGWTYDVDATPKMEPPAETTTEPSTEDTTELSTEGETESESTSVTEGETESESTSSTEGETESENTSAAEGETESENTAATESETENETESATLPQTGRLLWPIPVLAVLGVLFFAVGRVLSTADKR